MTHPSGVVNELLRVTASIREAVTKADLAESQTLLARAEGGLLVCERRAAEGPRPSSRVSGSSRNRRRSHNSGIDQVGRRRQRTGVPEAERREADREGVAEITATGGQPASSEIAR